MTPQVRAGFTLFEVMAVLAVIAITALIAVPSINRLVDNQGLEEVARTFMGDLGRARALAIGRQRISNDGERILVRGAGIRVDTVHRYTIYADPDTDPDNDNEFDIRMVDVRTVEGSGDIQIASPAAGERVRFDQRGGASTQTFLIQDVQSRRQRQVTITAGGQTRLN